MKIRNTKTLTLAVCGTLVFALVISTGCTSMNLVAKSDQHPAWEESPESWHGHGSFHNDCEKNVVKVRKIKKDEKSASKEPQEEEEVNRDPDYLGKKSNSVVTYKITYWDSLISVLSLGFYVPFEVEYEVAKKGSSQETQGETKATNLNQEKK